MKTEVNRTMEVGEEREREVCMSAVQYMGEREPTPPTPEQKVVVLTSFNHWIR